MILYNIHLQLTLFEKNVYTIANTIKKKGGELC